MLTMLHGRYYILEINIFLGHRPRKRRSSFEHLKQWNTVDLHLFLSFEKAFRQPPGFGLRTSVSLFLLLLLLFAALLLLLASGLQQHGACEHHGVAQHPPEADGLRPEEEAEQPAEHGVRKRGRGTEDRKAGTLEGSVQPNILTIIFGK